MKTKNDIKKESTLIVKSKDQKKLESIKLMIDSIMDGLAVTKIINSENQTIPLFEKEQVDLEKKSIEKWKGIHANTKKPMHFIWEKHKDNLVDSNDNELRWEIFKLTASKKWPNLDLEKDKKIVTDLFKDFKHDIANLCAELKKRNIIECKYKDDKTHSFYAFRLLIPPPSVFKD
jgi:hypothetical protein